MYTVFNKPFLTAYLTAYRTGARGNKSVGERIFDNYYLQKRSKQSKIF